MGGARRACRPDRLVVGWVVGAVSGSIVYPDEKLVRGQHVPAYQNRKKHAEHVDWVLTFATWSGLAIAQSVFLVLHLGRDAQPTDRKIGSNR